MPWPSRASAPAPSGRLRGQLGQARRAMDRAPANAGEIGLRKKPFRDSETTVDEERSSTPTRSCAGGPRRRMKPSLLKTPPPMDDRRRLGQLRKPRGPALSLTRRTALQHVVVNGGLESLEVAPALSSLGSSTARPTCH